MKRQKVRKAIILISFLLLPVVLFYFSPFLIIWGASMGIVTGSFVTFTILFFLSLLFGRAFCGRVCPTGGLQEYCFAVNDGKPKGGRYNWIKYFLWVPWMVVIAIVALIAGGLNKVDIFFMTENGVSISEPIMYIIYYGIIVFLITLALQQAGGRVAITSAGSPHS